MQIINFNSADVQGDSEVIARATASGVAIDTIDITGHRLDADVLARLWTTADRRIDDVQAALQYAAVKEAIRKAHYVEPISRSAFPGFTIANM